MQYMQRYPKSLEEVKKALEKAIEEVNEEEYRKSFWPLYPDKLKHTIDWGDPDPLEESLKRYDDPYDIDYPDDWEYTLQGNSVK